MPARAPGTRGRRVGVTLAGALLLAAQVAAQPGLSASAGLGGHARAGRWMPVQVVVESAVPRDGVLTVEWGRVRATRPLRIARGPTTATVMLRSGDPRGHVRVTFQDSAGPVAVTTPVVVDADDVPLAICLDGASDPACTTVLPPGTTPRDWRAYDAATAVVLGNAGHLDEAQREAVALAAGRRQADGAFGAPAPQALIGGAPPARAAAPWLLLALLAPAVVGLPWTRRAWIRTAAGGGILVLASAAALAAGRSGPAATVRHATVLHAFRGAPHTLGEMRAVVNAATDGPIAIALRTEHGWLERTDPEPVPLTLDGAGIPTVALTARMGSAYRLDAEFTGPTAPVRVHVAGAAVTLEHTGTTPLTACRWPAALRGMAAETITPGARLALEGAVEPGDAVTCVWPEAPVSFTGGEPVPAGSGTLLLIHLDAVFP